MRSVIAKNIMQIRTQRLTLERIAWNLDEPGAGVDVDKVNVKMKF